MLTKQTSTSLLERQFCGRGGRYLRKFSFVEVCGGITWVLMIAMGLWRHEYPDYMDVEVNFVAVEGDGGKWRQMRFLYTPEVS